ncbi:MAG: hypothetical protein ACKPKO_38560, partial [Candidatus Fonsibacter sp.]
MRAAEAIGVDDGGQDIVGLQDETAFPDHDPHDGSVSLQGAFGAVLDGKLQQVFVLKDFSLAFRAKHRLLDDNGRNFHHIQSISVARLLLMDG